MEWLGHTPSWSDEFLTRTKGIYECEYCGVRLEDHEAHVREGKVFCGCCAWK